MIAHGTKTRYGYGCRCDACRAANIAAMRAWRQRRARIQWGAEPPALVDAEPVRAHVLQLMAAGVGWERIADLSGVSKGSVNALLYRTPRTRRVRPDTAEKILALRAADCVADGAYVDPSGTRRRIQALAAAGWCRAEIARRLGIKSRNMPMLLTARRVRARTARQVRELYDQLWDQPPPAATGRQRAAVAQSRRTARELGWPPPAAWDDDLIDLPEAELAAELQRRVAAMGEDELQACHHAHYRRGDPSPLVVAAARECARRMKRAHLAGKAAG